MSTRSHNQTSNLHAINSAFQQHCWHLLSHISSPLAIFCDFPSQISNPPSHFKIFWLDDFPHFLHNIEAFPDLQVIVTTQQYSYLAKLISPIHSIQRPFKLYSRSHSASPFEMKIIEISSVVPFGVFQKTTNIQYHTTFQVRLRNAKGPFIKHFDLFELDINPIIEDSSILSPLPPLQICGLAHTTNFSLYEEITHALRDIAIPYSNTNSLQALINPLSHIISFDIIPSSSSTATSIEVLLNQLQTIFKPIPSFIFCAYSISNYSYINFVSKRKIDPETIVTLLDLLNIPHLIITSGLVFVASLEHIEEICILAPRHNISIPSHFIQEIQKFTFEIVQDHIKICRMKITTSHLTNLQIIRLDPGCPTETYFTQQFLDFIRSRFACNSGAQLQTIQDGTGSIHEVLTFSSSADFSSDDSDLRLPLPFIFESQNFLLSYLEPIFNPKPKSTYQYPYESSIEHFERFTNVSDSLASRIPIVIPHTDKGGPIALQIISDLTSGALPTDPFLQSYPVSNSSPSFYILLAPFPPSWQTAILDILPSSLVFQPCKFIDIGCFSPKYIILELPPRSQFPIPFLPPKSAKEETGEMGVREAYSQHAKG